MQSGLRKEPSFAEAGGKKPKGHAFAHSGIFRPDMAHHPWAIDLGRLAVDLKPVIGEDDGNGGAAATLDTPSNFPRFVPGLTSHLG